MNLDLHLLPIFPNILIFEVTYSEDFDGDPWFFESEEMLMSDFCMSVQGQNHKIKID